MRPSDGHIPVDLREIIMLMSLPWSKRDLAELLSPVLARHNTMDVCSRFIVGAVIIRVKFDFIAHGSSSAYMF